LGFAACQKVRVESSQVRFADDGDPSGPVEGAAQTAIPTYTDAGFLVRGAARGVKGFVQTRIPEFVKIHLKEH
jgi:hypothetical protein